MPHSTSRRLRSRSRRGYCTRSGGRVKRRRSNASCKYVVPLDRETYLTGPVGTFSTTASRCPKNSAVAADGTDGRRWCCPFTQAVRTKYAETLVTKGMSPELAIAEAVRAAPNKVEAARLTRANLDRLPAGQKPSVYGTSAASTWRPPVASSAGSYEPPAYLPGSRPAGSFGFVGST